MSFASEEDSIWEANTRLYDDRTLNIKIGDTIGWWADYSTDQPRPPELYTAEVLEKLSDGDLVVQSPWSGELEIIKAGWLCSQEDLDKLLDIDENDISAGFGDSQER